jgi:hypothetical protein
MGCVLRAAAAEIQNWRAVAPGIENRHARVLQADHIVQAGSHDIAGDPGVTIGQSHGDLFVRAHDDLGTLTRLEIHHRVVQAAITGAGIQGDVFDSQLAQHFDHEIRAILRIAFFADARRPYFRYARRSVLFCHAFLRNIMPKARCS